MPTKTRFEGMQPTEAIRFFRDKENLPTLRWDDVLRDAHNRAFVVAGAAKMELLAGLRGAVDKALVDGESLGEFRKRFDEVVRRAGWDYNGSRGWRSALVYRQNLQSAYAAGRYDQMTDPAVTERRPYWLYRHGGSASPRPDHQGWDGLVLKHDDPWWQTHYPPNGYGCSCSAFALDEEAAKERGIASRAPDDGTYTHRRVNKATGEYEEIEVPKGITPGFDYAPGRSWKRRFTDELAADPTDIKNITPAPGARPLPDFPTDTIADDAAPRILADADPEEAVAAYLRRFDGLLEDGVYTDAMGERIPVSRDLFVDRATGKLKLGAEKYKSRSEWLEYIAETIKDPAEIRVHLEPVRRPDRPEAGGKKYFVVRHYLRRIVTSDGKERNFFVVFRAGSGGKSWDFQTTAFPVSENTAFDRLRQGLLLYRRPGEE